MKKNIKAKDLRNHKIRFWNRSISLTVGTIIILSVLVLALFPEFIATHDPTAINAKEMLLAPSSAHFFGTDDYGRDVFSRVVWATRIDLQIGIFAMMIPFITGTAIGLIAGYYGGKVDSILMRILDIFMAFPYMVLCIAIVAILGAGIWSLYIAMWLVGWKEYTRLIRSEVMVVKNLEFIQAAKVLGYTDSRIILRHILPNVLSSAIVYGASDIVMCMMSGAALSFLGLGVQAPTPEWGAIISGGKAFLVSAWWITVFPGILMAFTGFGFSMIGDGLSDLLRTKGR